MVSALVILCVLAVDGPEPAKLTPATAVAVAVAEGAGATVKELTLLTVGLGAGDEQALREAFARTGLFTLVERDRAQAVVEARRQDNVVRVVVTAADGKQLLAHTVDWPAAPTAPVEGAEAVYRRVLKYQRERVRVMPVVRGYVGTPIVVGGWASNWFGNPMPWGLGFGGAVPVSTAPNDWVIMRGSAQSIDEMEMARLIGDERLAHHIEEGRFWPRVWWVTAFGTAAAAGIGSGSYIQQRGGRDNEALGVSLIAAGVVSGVLALMAPALGKRHVLNAGEAQALVDTYNEKLRADIGVSPDDVAKYPETP